MLAILVPGGMAAMAFGVAFGSVFGREDLIPALWLHPLAQPLPVLGATLGLGVAVIVLGLALDALQAAWRRQGLRWLATRAGLVLAYAGLVASFGRREALWLLPIGALWFTAGTTLVHRPRGAALPAALGELVEALLQLAVNTVSFVRVGAFALAHAGLCAAVVGMAEAAGGGWKGMPVLVLGNVLIIGLEGLVVGIQTTRLVLFEFFIRFLTAEGRALKPLAGPAALVRTSRRTPL
jgi:V/A-type H+-transporting ATPase subunit I